MFHNIGAIFGPLLGGIMYDLFAPHTWTFGNVEVFGIQVIMIITTILAFISAIIIGFFVKKKDLVTKVHLINRIDE